MLSIIVKITVTFIAKSPYSVLAMAMRWLHPRAWQPHPVWLVIACNFPLMHEGIMEAFVNIALSTHIHALNVCWKSVPCIAHQVVNVWVSGIAVLNDAESNPLIVLLKGLQWTLNMNCMHMPTPTGYCSRIEGLGHDSWDWHGWIALWRSNTAQANTTLWNMIPACAELEDALLPLIGETNSTTRSLSVCSLSLRVCIYIRDSVRCLWIPCPICCRVTGWPWRRRTSWTRSRSAW